MVSYSVVKYNSITLMLSVMQRMHVKAFHSYRNELNKSNIGPSCKHIFSALNLLKKIGMGIYDNSHLVSLSSLSSSSMNCQNTYNKWLLNGVTWCKDYVRSHYISLLTAISVTFPHSPLGRSTFFPSMCVC